MMHGWQSESTDGQKGGYDFWSGCSGHLTHNCRMQCSVAKCNVIVVCSCSCSVVGVVEVVEAVCCSCSCVVVVVVVVV